VKRSRVSGGVRLYQLTVPAGSERGDACERLFTLAGSRAGRMVLSKNLRAENPTPQQWLRTAGRFLEEDK